MFVLVVRCGIEIGRKHTDTFCTKLLSVNISKHGTLQKVECDRQKCNVTRCKGLLT